MTHEQLIRAGSQSLYGNRPPFMLSKSSPVVHNYLFPDWKFHQRLDPKMKECSVRERNTKKWVSIAAHRGMMHGERTVPGFIRIMLHCCTSREMNCEGRGMYKTHDVGQVLVTPSCFRSRPRIKILVTMGLSCMSYLMATRMRFFKLI